MFTKEFIDISFKRCDFCVDTWHISRTTKSTWSKRYNSSQIILPSMEVTYNWSSRITLDSLESLFYFPLCKKNMNLQNKNPFHQFLHKMYHLLLLEFGNFLHNFLHKSLSQSRAIQLPEAQQQESGVLKYRLNCFQ